MPKNAVWRARMVSGAFYVGLCKRWESNAALKRPASAVRSVSGHHIINNLRIRQSAFSFQFIPIGTEGFACLEARTFHLQNDAQKEPASISLATGANIGADPLQRIQELLTSALA